MAHSVPHTVRAAAPWAPASRWFDWLYQAAAIVLCAVRRPRGPGNSALELRMSDEWLAQYERESSKRFDSL
jgi:hypothetical protein